MNSIIAERLAEVRTLHYGAHKPGERMCAMEAVAYIAGETWTASPQCACPVIASFMRSWNDTLPDAERDALLLPLIPRLVGTRGDAALEERRSLMAADWLVRVHTPAWLRSAGLTAQANELSSLPEITSLTQVSSIHGPLEAARRDANAVRDSVWAAEWGATRPAPWDATLAAADAAWGAAWDATWVLTRDAAWYAARAAARATAWNDTWEVAQAALADTKRELQQSAVALVIRMVEAE